MLKRLTAIFAPEQGAEDEAATARRATAALLAETGLADGVFDAAERAMAEAALSRLYALSDADAAALLTAAEAEARDAVDHYRFTAAVKAATTVEERAELLTELWRVAYADGRRDAHEDAFLRRLAGLLHVPDREATRARRRAEQG